MADVAAPFSRAVLQIDPGHTVAHIERHIRDAVLHRLRRRGVVVGLSGGIDSSVVAVLAARALGADRVVGLLMPEIDSSPDSLRLGRLVADTLGIRTFVEDVSGILEAAGCYRRRDEAIRLLAPEYSDGYRCKLVLPDVLGRDEYPIYFLVIEAPDGAQTRIRVSLDAYLGIVAATNFKQRVRAMMEYHYADRFRFAVAGTPNLLEYDLGFFVKHGDGSADLKPIAHLYKSQVYQLAEYLQLPDEVRKRRSTTDTYSLEQSQEEFYFGLSLENTDLCLYARNHGITAEDASEALGFMPQQIERVYRSIEAKRLAARYLHAAPILCD